LRLNLPHTSVRPSQRWAYHRFQKCHRGYFNGGTKPLETYFTPQSSPSQIPESSASDLSRNFDEISAPLVTVDASMHEPEVSQERIIDLWRILCKRLPFFRVRQTTFLVKCLTVSPTTTQLFRMIADSRSLEDHQFQYPRNECSQLSTRYGSVVGSNR
jgi:hypothetical protein